MTDQPVKKRRGRPPKVRPNGDAPPPPVLHAPAGAEVMVKALEDAGLVDAVRVAEKAAGLPPRKLAPEEDFALSVRELVTGGPVGYNLGSAEEAEQYAELVATLPAPGPNRRYFVARQRGPNGEGTRLEVSLRGV